MHHRPADIDDRELRDALRAWDIGATSLVHAPVGFGDHHWYASDDRGRRWFVTVADLAHKSHCGDGPEAAFHGLRAAMDTAAELRDGDGDVSFVVAPLRSPLGETVRRLGVRYGVSVFPYVAGEAGEFGQKQPPAERGRVLELLADLHGRTPPAVAPRQPAELSGRIHLERALDESGAATASRAGHEPEEAPGPFREPARALVAEHAGALREVLTGFDRLSAEVARRRAPWVVTHGEPHPGNLLRAADDGRFLLLDWDTVGLAVPERDLWPAATGPDDLARYAELTGRQPDASALELYRLRWDLEDIAEFLSWFRAPHDHHTDTERGWADLTEIVERLAGSTRRTGPVS